jgi:hypothetical protein
LVNCHIWVGLGIGCDGVAAEAALCVSSSAVAVAAGSGAAGWYPPWIHWRSVAELLVVASFEKRVISGLNAASEGWTKWQ